MSKAYVQKADARGRRYKPETRELARRLHGTGWTVEQIVSILNNQDIPARAETVRCWVDEEYRQRRAKATKGARRRRDDPKGRFVRRRMLELHALGLDYTAISVVIGLYHDRLISKDAVRYFIASEKQATT